MNHIKKAFTLTELIIVVAIIWILMMGVTVYVWWIWERAKTIEAQWCAGSFWWEISNYVFNGLTSKNIKLVGTNTTVSPDYYYIQLTGGTSTNTKNCTKTNYTWTDWTYCNGIIFWYTTWDNNQILGYRTLNMTNTCRQNQGNIWFFWSWWNNSDIKYIKMNKWFAPRSVNERKVFYLQHDTTHWSMDENQLTEGDIIIVYCPNVVCSMGKQIARYNIDARTQTISFQRCRFYQDDGITCDARED